MVPKIYPQDSALCRMPSDIEVQRISIETGIKYEQLAQMFILARQVADSGLEILKPYQEAGIVGGNGHLKLEDKV